ncbi:Squalene epoxidase [Cryptotrichosporon argae]
MLASSSTLPSLSPEIIIVGAGIAGTALAYSLARAGRRCLLIERDLSQPDRIVGELLQPGGVAALHALGLADCLEGIDAVPVEGYCCVAGERQVAIPYPVLEELAGGAALGAGAGVGAGSEKGGVGAEAGLADKWLIDSASGKKEGRSFHHGRFVSALRQKCIDEPALAVLEATVKDLVFCEHTSHVLGVTVSLKPGSASAASYAAVADPGAGVGAGSSAPTTATRNIYAPLTIIADGCFSKFRSVPGTRTPTPATRSHFVGAVVKDLELPMPRHGTVCLTPEGPVLLYQIADEAHETRMLVDVKGKLPSVADGSLKNHILDHYVPHLPPQCIDSIAAALETQRLRTMPNSFLPPSMQGVASSLRGAILVGDAWNMRHPLTGGGMTVAFHDAVLLTDYLRPSNALPAGRDGLERWDVIAARLRDWFWARKKLAGTVNVLSFALYDLFGGADDDLALLREGCFQYFELGGARVSEPVGLLSALAPRPLTLFYHFFSVALYTIYILFTQGPPPRAGEKRARPPSWSDVPHLAYSAVHVFYTACVVFLPVMASEFKI